MSWALSAITGNPAVNFLRMSGVWNAFKPAGGGTLSQEGEFSDDEFFKFHGWFEIFFRHPSVFHNFHSSVRISESYLSNYLMIPTEIPSISYPSHPLTPSSICRV